jgi:hypothetical protein
VCEGKHLLERRDRRAFASYQPCEVLSIHVDGPSFPAPVTLSINCRSDIPSYMSMISNGWSPAITLLNNLISDRV